MLIVTIDSGTTNTRVRVWQGDQIIGYGSTSVGVRDVAMAGTTEPLSKGIKTALHQSLEQAGLTTESEFVIVASGMLSSNVGLCEIPHIQVPAGINELARYTVKKCVPEIIDKQICFIPGVKNAVSHISLDNYEHMDIMRGEECEVIGVVSLLKLQGPALIILPGSHSKFIQLDETNRIVSSSTTMAGELLDIITQNTILANSLEHRFADTIDTDYLLKGAESCRQVGLSRSAFSIRILDLFTKASLDQKASFLLGAVFHSDISAIKHSQALTLLPNSKIVICGKKILTEVLTTLIKHDAFFTGEIISFEEQRDAPLSSLGAISIVQQIDF
ncbi:TPA: 2-dehydro-3-deoxygalactonokinase [Escherichia coli]